MVCLGNMCVDTLHKAHNDDDDDDDDDDDNNNNNNNNNQRELLRLHNCSKVTILHISVRMFKMITMLYRLGSYVASTEMR